MTGLKIWKNYSILPHHVPMQGSQVWVSSFLLQRETSQKFDAVTETDELLHAWNERPTINVKRSEHDCMNSGDGWKQ